MADCLVDARPSADARLCSGCLETLKAELRSLLPHWEQREGRRELVAGLIGELEVTLTRQARIGERNGPRSTEVPLPFHFSASVDLETVRDTLAMWARAVADQRGITVDAAHEPVALTKWLLRWAGEVAQHEDAGELHAQVLSMTKTARRTIDLAAERRYVGPCDGHRAIVPETVGCNKDLYAPVNRLTVRCATEGCGAEYQIETRRVYLLEAAYGRLLTAAEMSRAIGELVPGQSRAISANLISQWAARGLTFVEADGSRGRKQLPTFLHHPKDPHKRTRFLVEDVIRFARQAMGAQDQPKSA